jgi:hypothetical protein
MERMVTHLEILIYAASAIYCLQKLVYSFLADFLWFTVLSTDGCPTVYTPVLCLCPYKQPTS